MMIYASHMEGMPTVRGSYDKSPETSLAVLWFAPGMLVLQEGRTNAKISQKMYK